MRDLEHIPCPVCGNTYNRDATYKKAEEIVIMICKSCGYQWRETPLNKLVVTEKEKKKIDTQMYDNGKKLEQANESLRIITTALVDKIIELADES